MRKQNFKHISNERQYCVRLILKNAIAYRILVHIKNTYILHQYITVFIEDINKNNTFIFPTEVLLRNNILSPNLIGLFIVKERNSYIRCTYEIKAKMLCMERLILLNIQKS